MQALVAASEKVRALLNPIGEYNHRMDQLLKDGLSTTDARKELEAKEPALVLARDEQTVIQRRAQLLAEPRPIRRIKSVVKDFEQLRVMPHCQQYGIVCFWLAYMPRDCQHGI
jgi:hypothetical protein